MKELTCPKCGTMIPDSLTIRKLTHGNPTMKAKFADAKEITERN